MQTNYPEAVQDWLEKVYESLVEMKFFEENDVNPEYGKEALFNQAGPAALASWLDSGEIVIEDSQLGIILGATIAETALLSLQKIGLIDNFPNEEGDNYVLTALGQQTVSQILNQ